MILFIGALRKKLKRILPKKIQYYYYLRSARKAVMFDLKRRVRDAVYNDSKAERLKRDLTMAYHIVEKGLTMPEPRPGFGKAIVLWLGKTVIEYREMDLPQQELEFRQSISVLKEYKEFHQKIDFQLDEEVNSMLDKIENDFDAVQGHKQIRITKEDYFGQIDQPFDLFSRSRCSVRNYTQEEVPMEVLMDCIDLAQKSPSFCNRQPTRVHVIKSPEKKQQILGLQNGNRGFGHLAETLLVITSIISTTRGIYERNENHLNGGLFAMTLLYALHQNNLGACPLNWSVTSKKEQGMRDILELEDNEIALLVISVGYIPDEISIASSPRKTAKEITKTHI